MLGTARAWLYAASSLRTDRASVPRQVLFMDVTFLLNGSQVTARGISPTTTLLDWLREARGLTGTKEGCNEGDCGACSVMVTDENGARALNGCILFLPQVDGKAVRTVEGLAGPDGTLHPAQQALIDHHGSQCGFCTPGFAVSMAVAHLNGATDHETQLAGNLCRCTGYAPILRAARTIEDVPPPDHLNDMSHLSAGNTSGGPRPPAAAGAEPPAFQPKTADALAEWYLAHPEATLVAGATDVGLWVTKQLREITPVAFINGVHDLRGVDVTSDTIRIGAVTTLNELQHAIAPHHPAFAELIRRYGSVQVRNAATIGGNIANGSPIGDGAPALIALGATLHLRRGADRRTVPLEDFFLEYGRQDRAPSEFVEAISFPRQPDHLHCYKLSKRFDQDISAVCGCFWIAIADGTVREIRLAYGGMAGIPKRARAAEQALRRGPWTEDRVRAAMRAMDADFTPLSDMRASAEYRMAAARNMLLRAFHADAGTGVDVLEVRP